MEVYRKGSSKDWQKKRRIMQYKSTQKEPKNSKQFKRENCFVSHCTYILCWKIKQVSETQQLVVAASSSWAEEKSQMSYRQASSCSPGIWLLFYIQYLAQMCHTAIIYLYCMAHTYRLESDFLRYCYKFVFKPSSPVSFYIPSVLLNQRTKQLCLLI